VSAEDCHRDQFGFVVADCHRGLPRSAHDRLQRAHDRGARERRRAEPAPISPLEKLADVETILRIGMGLTGLFCRSYET
jgi:hypothetical protein